MAGDINVSIQQESINVAIEQPEILLLLGGADWAAQWWLISGDISDQLDLYPRIIPQAGEANQILWKVSPSDYDVDWLTITATNWLNMPWLNVRLWWSLLEETSIRTDWYMFSLWTDASYLHIDESWNTAIAWNSLTLYSRNFVYLQLPSFNLSPASSVPTLINPTTWEIRYTQVVNSIAGTSNQIIASAWVGGITLSTPQDIATTSAVTFWKLTVAGAGMYIKEWTNATMGVATLVAGTVVVNTTKVTASSRIQLTIQSIGTVTVPTTIGVTARTAGTSFTITSANIVDTSTIAWLIVEPA